MLEGVRLAEETGSRLELIDRDVQVTLKRLWGFLSFWKKTKLVFKMLLGFLEPEEIDVSVVENLKKKDQLEILMEQFGQDLPEIKERLIDERDVYLAQKIRAAPGKTLVAVVGAGHVPGIVREIQKVSPLAPLETVPPPSKIIRGIKWAIPAAIVLLILSGFFLGQSEKSIESIYLWILVNGILSALGVLLALGHPLTVLSAFIAAPLTSLNPMVAAGWVSGLVQAWIKKPTVSDFEALPGDIFSFKGFWTNPVSRIILVVAFANLGSSIGTFVAGSWIATKMI
jgi:pheromone shutdown-related protein TraB